MKRLGFALLLAVAVSGTAFSAMPELELGFSNVNANVEAKVNGDASRVRRMGEMASLGVKAPLAGDLSFSLRIGYGEIGENSKYVDRVVKLLPRYTVYRLNEAGSVYATGGVGYHNTLLSGTQNEVYTSAAGLGFENKVNTERLKVTFELLYEKSFKADDYFVGRVSVKNYRLESLETAVAIGFAF